MRNRFRIIWGASLHLLLLLPLGGCVNGRTLRIDYENYSEAYGNAFNKQILLNLARESQQDPVYFLQLGSISSQYQFSTSGGLTSSATRTAPPSIATPNGLVQRALTFGGSFNSGETQTPVFQFLPMTGSNYVQALLQLLPDKIFWSYYDQGWEADWIVRIMVDSIRLESNSTNRTSSTKIYFNDPTDPTYPKFLEFCSELRDAQFYQTLVVERITNNAKIIFESRNPKLTEIVAAVQAGLSVERSSGLTTVKTKTEVDFELTTNKYYEPNEYTDCYACNATTLSNALLFSTQVKIYFNFRTFEGIMNSVACEQDLFTNKYNTGHIQFTNDGYGPIAIVTRSLPFDTRPRDQAIFTNRPILMIKNNARQSGAVSKLVEIEYGKERYSIGDTDQERFPPYLDSNQNRTVFGLLSYLFSETAINTQNLPVQQLIQVQ